MSNAAVEVAFFDTTLRDGAQALPDAHQFPEGAKPDIADHIAGMGVEVIEAGFPATPGDAAEVAAVAETVGQRYYPVHEWTNDGETVAQTHRSPIIAGLSRTVPSDIEATWSAVSAAARPRIHTFISTDPEHMSAKFPGKSPDDVLVMGREAVRYARMLTDEHPDATVEFSAEAASTTDEAYLERVVKEAIAQGADIINVPDTVGQRDPIWMHGFYKKVIGWVMSSSAGVTVSAHNHNDLGMAAANSVMLVRAASDYVREYGQSVKVQMEGTVCGLGERAGNADMFSMAGGVFKFAPDMGVPVRWRFNPGRSVAVARMVMGYAGYEVDRQTPIVGSDTFVHRSGIHSDGVIKGGYQIYTPHDPKFWGHGEAAVHEDGRYQGRRGREAVAR
jgi:2-isopropylmalate synthase